MLKRLFSARTLAIAALAPAIAAAQGMDHSKMAGMDKMAMDKMGGAVPSQAAFATIQDIVKKLKADPKTDWSKVNLEALRQHLIDMDNVVMRAQVKQANVEGGVSLDVTGTGDVAASIKRMGTMHAMALTEEGLYVAKASDLANGVRLVVTAKDPKDGNAVAMIRGLGFAGLMTEGDHHAMHHMMVARGEEMMHQHKP
jgi:hypothetical protein